METYHAIGLMSGTSLDGLDICYAKFHRAQQWSFQILHCDTLPYSEEWISQLRNAPQVSAEQFFELNSRYGFYLADAVNDFIRKNNIGKVDVVSSHGHTVFHQPEKKFTAQIGDGRAIKLKTGLPTVYDFRPQDVLLGGNGAPLVPIGDELLFSEYDACINLGGFSNISFKAAGRRVAFDICALNIVLNRYANILGLPYDDCGRIAKSNKPELHLLKKLNDIQFYSIEPPKSLGNEWVEKFLIPNFVHFSPETVLSTFTLHAAHQISRAIRHYRLKNILLTGGGAHNSYLVELIRSASSAEIILPERTVIDFKEALIFALMGILRIKKENNVLSSATGSLYDHCTGILA